MDFGSDQRPSKARTLGGDRAREVTENRPIREVSNVWLGGPGDAPMIRLPIPVISTLLEYKIEETSDIVEATNPEDGHGKR